ncbi:unnamed protein product, partial [Dovyalis caffra]
KSQSDSHSWSRVVSANHGESSDVLAQESNTVQAHHKSSDTISSPLETKQIDYN